MDFCACPSPGDRHMCVISASPAQAAPATYHAAACIVQPGLQNQHSLRPLLSFLRCRVRRRKKHCPLATFSLCPKNCELATYLSRSYHSIIRLTFRLRSTEGTPCVPRIAQRSNVPSIRLNEPSSHE